LATAQVDIHRNIIEKCKRGNSKAQYELYSLYSRAMFNISMRMMNTREEAEDMLQEAFSEAFNKLDSFRYESTFGAWLKRIVVNKCINEIKRRKADLTLFEDMSPFDSTEDEPVEYPEGMSVEHVKKAMEQLPKGSRMIFSLYLLEGYDHQEISQILDISESNSKSQYMRAKRRIAEIIKDKRYEN
jgi:RNA polymerase sigma-70 factor (ECF subfamily)